MKKALSVIALLIIGVMLFDQVRTSTPLYMRNRQYRELACDSHAADGTLVVASADEGASVQVQYGELKADLDFVRSSIFLVDYYRGGDVELSLDPEGRISGGVFGEGLGLCAF